MDISRQKLRSYLFDVNAGQLFDEYMIGARTDAMVRQRNYLNSMSHSGPLFAVIAFRS